MWRSFKQFGDGVLALMLLIGNEDSHKALNNHLNFMVIYGFVTSQTGMLPAGNSNAELSTGAKPDFL